MKRQKLHVNEVPLIDIALIKIMLLRLPNGSLNKRTKVCYQAAAGKLR